MSDNTQLDEIKAFFETWELYTIVIEENYMIHQEVMSHLIQRLTQLGWTDISVLEVGCGDARVVSEIARRLMNIESYFGIELSRMAMDFASDNLKRKVDEVTLINGDMVEETPYIDQQFDLVIAGYTIHHLDRKAKVDFLRSLKDRLRPGGLLIVYNLVSEEDEAPDAFIERLIGLFNSNWSELSPEQVQNVSDHVSQNDKPESWSSWRDIASESGFETQRFPFHDENRVFGIMEFLDQS